MELIDSGSRVPLDQILAGPPLEKLHFNPDSPVRSIGDMLAGKGAPVVPLGKGAGPRKGWGSVAPGAHVAYRSANVGTDVGIGKVVLNEREERRVVVQPYRG